MTYGFVSHHVAPSIDVFRRLADKIGKSNRDGGECHVSKCSLPSPRDVPAANGDIVLAVASRAHVPGLNELGLHNDGEAQEALSNPALPTTQEGWEQWWSAATSGQSATTRLWAVVADHDVVGAAFAYLEPHAPWPFLEVVIGATWRHTGIRYGPYAVRAMIDHLFTEPDCEAIQGRVLPTNERSIQMITNLGFKRRGKPALPDLRRFDLYEITRGYDAPSSAGPN